MFCPSCGQAVAENFSFCPSCGSSLTVEKVAPPTPIVWESCEIVCKKWLKAPGLFSKGQAVFTAESVGKNGLYEVAQSEPFPISRSDFDLWMRVRRFSPKQWDSKVGESFNRFVTRLQKDGWIHEGKGSLPLQWFSQKFHRTNSK